jgi:hypothetical protein
VLVFYRPPDAVFWRLKFFVYDWHFRSRFIYGLTVRSF